MKKLLILFLALVICSNAQTKKPIEQNKTETTKPCTISTADKLKLRGFYLRQHKNDLSGMQFFETTYKEKISDDVVDSGKFGLVMVNSIDLFYRTPGVRTVSNKEYEDIDFYLHFLDEKLMYLSVKYNEYEPDNLKIFMKQVSEKTGLPIESWKVKDKFNAEMRCVDFDVELWTGQLVGRPEYSDYPSLTLSDRTAETELNKRREEYKRKLIEAEKERKRLEQEKRKTFKP